MHYSDLFTIKIHHDYFLNDGVARFNEMDPAQQSKQLDLYDLNEFLMIEPSLQTQRKLKNQRFLYRIENDIFKVAVEIIPPADVNDGLPRIPVISINENLELVFVVKFKSPDFVSYTDLTFLSNRLFLLTNEKVTPSSTIPVIQNEPLTNPDDAYITDAFFMDALTQATVTAGMDTRELFGAVGIIRIKMISSAGANKSIIIDNKSIYNPAHGFIVQLKNKELYWQYQKVSDDSKYLTNAKQPLVKHGFVTIDPETGLTPPLVITSGLKLPNPITLSLEKVEVGSTEELSTVIYI